MQLTFTHRYDAAPAQVVALLRTPEFIDDVAQHAGALEHAVEIHDDVTELQMKLPVPGHLTRFVGQSIQLDLGFRFAPARPDGTITGTVSVDVPGMPVDVHADAVLTPEGEATVGRYSGELKVKIPLVGKKVEAQVEPFIREAFAGIERRAAVWLAR